MTDETQLERLLLLWHDHHAAGRDIPIAELCRDCAALAPELERRIGALRRSTNFPPDSNAALEPPSSIAETPFRLAPTPAGWGDTPHTNAGAPGSGPGSGPFVPGYQILGELGRGGMGVVYKALDLTLNRVTALKVVRTRDYAALLARLRAEAEAAARLHHPHIVQVFACGEHAGQPYFAMEYVEGGSLDRHLGGRPQPPHEAARLVLLLARAVHAAHRQGVVHRDLKPANILLAPPADEPALNSAYGCPKIADFGLARYLDSNSGQTGSGDLLGTPSYMAPEQAAGKTREVGPAADVYALGVILYEVLTGTPPFKGENALQTLERVQSQLPQPPGTLQPGVPPELESICLRCLRKDPTQRYATAADLADDLSAFLNGDVTSLVRSRHRRWTLIAAAVALLLVGSVVGIVLWNQQPPPPLPVASPPPVPPAPIVEQPKQPVQVKPLQVVKQPPSDWKEYRPPDGRFAISLPGLPIESKRIIKIRNKDLQAREARLSDSSTRALYSVVFVDFPGITFKGDAKASLDAARDSAVVTARGELLREVPLRLDGHPGREILIRGKLLQFRVRIYQVGQRMYQFTIAAARDLTSCAEADRFFQSFRLLPEP